MTRTAMAVAVVAALSGCAAFSPGAKAPRATTVALERVSHSVGDAGGQYALGKYYLGQRRHALALVAFTKAIAADPAHVEARNGRAAALAQLGDLQAAATELEAAIQRAPESAHLHGNLGYVRMLAGEHRASAEALRRAFDLDPRNERVRANWSALAAKVAEDPAKAAVLAGRPAVASAGITAPAPAAVTPSAVREVVSASVMNLAYAPSPVDVGTMQSARPSLTVITVPAAGNSTAISKDSSTQDAGPALAAPSTVASAAASTAKLPPSAPLAAPPAAVAALKASSLEPPRAPARAQPPARVAVANGNGTPGIARRYGEALRSGSMQVVRISNAPRFDLARSKILFRDGHLDSALALSRRLASKPEIHLDNSIPSRVDVQLVLGNDAPQDGPLAENEAGPSQVASVSEARTER
ncbi:hypothetical protein GCM10023089_26980 [Quisquiliibacterium transsilvanicum]